MTLAARACQSSSLRLPTLPMATVITGRAIQEDVKGFLPKPSGAILKEPHGRGPNDGDEPPSLGQELGQLLFGVGLGGHRSGVFSLPVSRE